MSFKKYMHIERLGTDEVEGILDGECYIFPKIDGANASIWWDEKNHVVQCGSRNQLLHGLDALEGFKDYVLKQPEFEEFFKQFPDLRLYGEWLVLHTLKTYRPDAWNKFYVFDVYQNETPIQYEEYEVLLNLHGILFIPPICTITNPTEEQLLSLLDKNTYLIEDGKGVGEGIVIKNYDFINKYERTTWAKVVRNEFKEQNQKVFGHAELNGNRMIEREIAEQYVTEAFVDKLIQEIRFKKGDWQSQYISMLLGLAFHHIIVEEAWNFVKKFKQPTINFKTLNGQVIRKVKELKPTLF